MVVGYKEGSVKGKAAFPRGSTCCCNSRIKSHSGLKGWKFISGPCQRPLSWWLVYTVSRNPSLPGHQEMPLWSVLYLVGNGNDHRRRICATYQGGLSVTELNSASTLPFHQ